LIPTKEELEFLRVNLLDETKYWLIESATYRCCRNIQRRMRDRNNCVGKIGETIVYDNIHNQLMKNGFRYSDKAVPNSYRMRRYYRARRRRGDGIDIYLVIVDSKGKKYRCFIEISNWCKMHSINNYILHSRIIDKFDRYDPKDKYFHIIAINHRNIHLLQDRCQKLGILLMPIPEHYTPEFLNRLNERGEFDL
jgi:hypothetical protein